MKLLVTGGAGFIGSHFVRMLLAGELDGTGAPESHVVTVLDALAYSGVRANLDAVAGDPRMTFVVGDITDRKLVDQLVRGADAVVNIAAESHVDRSIVDATPFVRTNVLGTQTLLDAAREHGVARFLQVSTDEVYGPIEEGLADEMQPLAPTSPYAASKAAADLLALTYQRTHGLDVVITRSTNNYGSHQFPEKVIPLFVSNLLDGKAVPVHGDGGHVRDWLHVRDHCKAMACVLRDGITGEIYNIAGGSLLSTLELTKYLVEAVGTQTANIRFVPDRPSNDLRYALDATKVQRDVGFAPTEPFEAGIAEAVSWYVDNRAWWQPLKALCGLDSEYATPEHIAAGPRT
ncbi:MAG: dTDP-glucose 4,6-dehydratase [Actinomycetota bacterium]|nr:dTDP-glucose 4,6-dehydratase [Actinomycetota bacterium]